MDFGWQNIATLGLVLVAGLYFGRRLCRFGGRNTPPRCVGCHGCDCAKEDPQTLILLDRPAPKR